MVETMVLQWLEGLPTVDPTLLNNKYTRYGSKHGYKIVRKEHLRAMGDVKLLNKLCVLGECLLIPNFNRLCLPSLNGLLLRSTQEKKFIYHSYQPVPHGYALTEKTYPYPWIVLESALDADILRDLYPYTVALGGLNLSNATLQLLSATAPYLILAFDNDAPGQAAARKISRKVKSTLFTFPFGAKDIGELYDREDWDLCKVYLQNSIRLLTGDIC